MTSPPAVAGPHAFASKPSLLLIDGASLWFRAFYAIPEKITAPDGRPVNAVRGFLDMLAALVARERPGRMAVCLDLDWRPQFRVDAVPSYKAHRVAETSGHDLGIDEEEVPDTLTPQVPMIMDILQAFGIATVGAEGFEADDVLGTLAAREQRDPVVVVSGDRDLLQVVTDEPVPVRVLYVGRGIAKAELYGPAELAGRYGLPADRAGAAYAEFALLRGDPSDGLPGVAGIGEKTASRLLLQFGSLAALRDAAADPGSGLARGPRDKLLAAADYLDVALPVVQVCREAPAVSSAPDTLPAEPVDPAALDGLAGELGVGSAVERLRTALAQSTAAAR